MAQNEQQNEIERILSSIEPRKNPLTDHESDVIFQHQKKHLDEVVKRDLDDDAERELRPLLETAKAAQDAGAESPLAKAMEAMTRARGSDTSYRMDSSEPCRPEQQTYFVPGGNCSPPIIEGPPYTSGSPIEELVGPPATGESSVFRTSSSLSVPEAGKLSVGVANGKLYSIGTYPSSYNWLFGDANIVGANILHLAHGPNGFSLVPSCMNVSVNIQVGGSLAPYLLIPGGAKSTGNGLVGIFGKMYMTLYGGRSIGGPRTTGHKFLLAWSSHGSSSAPPSIPHSFSLSETLALRPGSSWVAVNLAVRLIAFRAGVDDPAGGFSGFDLRAPDEDTHGLWLLRPAGGPIQLSDLTMTFCSLGFIPRDELKA